MRRAIIVEPSYRKRIPTGVILETGSELHLRYQLQRAYPSGPHFGQTDIGKTREMFATTVNLLAKVLKDEGPYRVAVETGPRGASDMRGIIFVTKAQTLIIPVRVASL